MPVIMCTRDLWRHMGERGRPPKLPQSPFVHECRLGDWGATAVFAGRDISLVLALNERTYLAALVPLMRPHRVAMHLMLSVERQLKKFGVPPAAAKTEAEQLLEAKFGASRNRSLQGSLNDLAYHVEHYVESGIADLREVEDHLSRTPHVKRDPSFAEDAVRDLWPS